jgi:hypothetical protein
MTSRRRREEGDAEAKRRYQRTSPGVSRLPPIFAGRGASSAVTSASRRSITSPVEIRHGADACLTALAPITIVGSVFAECDGFGILKTSSDPTSYITGNDFVNVGLGAVGTL